MSVKLICITCSGVTAQDKGTPWFGGTGHGSYLFFASGVCVCVVEIPVAPSDSRGHNLHSLRMPTPAITAAPHEMKWLGSGDYIHSIFMDKDGEAPQTRQAYASRTPTYPYIHARKRGKPMHHARPHIHTSMHANEASLCNTHDHISIHPCTQTRQAYATRTPTYPYIHARMYPHTHRHHFTLPEQYDCPIGMAQVRHDSTLFFVTATAIYAGSASESTNHVTQPEPPPIPIPTLTRPNP